MLLGLSDLYSTAMAAARTQPLSIESLLQKQKEEKEMFWHDKNRDRGRGGYERRRQTTNTRGRTLIKLDLGDWVMPVGRTGISEGDARV